MKTAFIVLLCIAAVFAGEYEYDEGVLVLTDANFNEVLNEFDYTLVEFYAPWCGHCKNLAPHYAQAAQELATSHPNIRLAKMDATIHKDAPGRFEVKGFPTLKFFRKGQSTPISYEAGRTTPDIVNWLKKKTGPISVEVNSVEEAQKLIGDNQVLGFFFGTADSDEFSTFKSVAQSFDDVAFAHSHNDDVVNHFGVSGSGLILFKKFDEGKNQFFGTFSNEAVKEFLNTNRFPTVLPFDQKVAQRIFGEQLDAIFLVRENNEAGQSAEEAFTKAAETLKGQILLSVARIEDNLGQRLADYIGVSRDSLPTVKIVQPSQNMQKFSFDREFTAENLINFVEDFKAGKTTPHFKSAPIPAEPYEDDVRVIVGKNFEEIVLDPNTDVLVEYYAPWCGHCKSLAPIYSSLSRKLKGVENLVIAKMDATANEVKGLSVQGFPTIKFYSKGNKSNPVDYNGERTEQGFIDYLRQHSSAKLPSMDTPDL